MRTLRRKLLAMQGYKRLNYVQNPDKAFFLFDYHLTEKNKFVFDGCIDEILPNNVFTGTDNFYLGNGASYYTIFARYSDMIVTNMKFDLSKRHKFEIGKGVGLKVDGDVIKRPITATPFISERRLSILGNASPTGKLSFFKGKMCEFLLYEDDKLIMHLIPMKRKKDMLAGAYDLVNDKFYSSHTDAKFVGGVNKAVLCSMSFITERRVA